MASSQAERLRNIIEDEILTLKLKPGQRLDETKLADKYGTSRTPVREALRQLSSNGLIEIRPNKGAIVAKLGISDLIELFEVMAELEGACGRLAAQLCITNDINAIAGFHEDSRRYLEANDVDGFINAGIDFHSSIYYASRNSYLIKLTNSVRCRIAPYRQLPVKQMNRLSQSFQEHENILTAIRNGRAEYADSLLKRHILDKGADIRRLVSFIGTDTVAENVHVAVAPNVYNGIEVMTAK